MENSKTGTENFEGLQEEINVLKSKLSEKDEKISELELLLKWYEEKLRLNAQKKYGASSEQSTGEQLSFFNEAEATADRKIHEPDIEEITYGRKKKAGKREDDFSLLPTDTVIHELPEAEQVCPECGERLHVMGKEARKEITIIPAQVKVTEHTCNVYACRNCEKTGLSVPIIKAPMPGPVIKGSAASPSAVAHIMTQKYVTHTPLYRQEQEFIRQGIALSRQTMANWLIKASDDWLEHIYERLRRELMTNEVLHADETKVQVLHEPGRKATTDSYMWLYRTGGDTKKPVALYEYQETRPSGHIKRFLEGWKGYLHTDGYSGYHNLPDITVVGCWAHMRRKFDEALKGIPEKERGSSKAQTGLEYCNRLFALEQVFDERLNVQTDAKMPLVPAEGFKQRFEWRMKESNPVAETFFAWAKSLNALPKSLLGTALRYAVQQEKYLMNIYLDGRTELSNNRAERSVKPFKSTKCWRFSKAF